DDASSPLIIGGRLADATPYMAGLTDVGGTQSFCGGSWIAKNVVLTAAHCVEGSGTRMAVSSGLRNNNDHATAKLVTVKAVVPHERFDFDGKMHNDVALLFLEDAGVAALPAAPTTIELNADAALPGAKATVIGWGNTTSFGTLFENELRQVEVPVLKTGACKAAGGNYSSIDDTQICGGDLDAGGIDSCQGDSGGPLVATDASGKTVLTGVVSWGAGCALKQKPGVYTRVSSFTPWIATNLTKFDSLPETLSAAEVSTVTKTHCYQGFVDSTSKTAGDATLEERTSYSVDGTYYPLSTSGAGAFKPTTAEACAAGIKGEHKLDVTLVKRADNGLPFLKAVESPSGNAFTAATRGDARVNIRCATAKTTLSWRGSQGYGIASVKGDYYIVYEETDGAIPADAERQTCLVDGSGASYAFARNPSTGVETVYVTVKGSVFGGADGRTFRADPYSEGAADVEVLLQADTATTGKLSVKNGGRDDIHTWRLECSFAFSLTGAD
ncbi:MAG: serine protease, partial [Leptospiraceae bacterium]|nr:serine protease [Leptospiraceae bacterium]